MRNVIASLIVLLLVPALSGCGGGRATTGQAMSPNEIGNWELQRLPGYNALEAVRRLRPNWLARRGTPGSIAGSGTGSPLPKLHVDGVHMPLEELELVRAGDVMKMEFLDSGDATMRFGTGYTNGAILVTTNRED